MLRNSKMNLRNFLENDWQLKGLPAVLEIQIPLDPWSEGSEWTPIYLQPVPIKWTGPPYPPPILSLSKRREVERTGCSSILNPVPIEEEGHGGVAHPLHDPVSIEGIRREGLSHPSRISSLMKGMGWDGMGGGGDVAPSTHSFISVQRTGRGRRLPTHHQSCSCRGERVLKGLPNPFQSHPHRKDGTEERSPQPPPITALSVEKRTGREGNPLLHSHRTDGTAPGKGYFIHSQPHFTTETRRREGYQPTRFHPHFC